MKGPTLVIMAKAPVAGKVKTRLRPALTSSQCVSLYTAFIRDTVNLAALLPKFKAFLAFTPKGSEHIFRELTARKLQLIPQIGRGLGRRMYNIIRSLEIQFYSPVVVIGSDIPTLQPAAFERALKSLLKYDVCIGPSTDGGYYLIGMKQADERIFSNVAWSTSRVVEETVKNIEGTGLTLTMLDKHRDVDTFGDLEELCREIRKLSVTPGMTIPLHTKAWLVENGFYKDS